MFSAVGCQSIKPTRRLKIECFVTNYGDVWPGQVLPVSRHLHQALPQVRGEAAVRHLPGPHPAVLAGAGHDVIIERIPPTELVVGQSHDKVLEPEKFSNQSDQI